MVINSTKNACHHYRQIAWIHYANDDLIYVEGWRVDAPCAKERR
jgi:hypothetical protein